MPTSPTARVVLNNYLRPRRMSWSELAYKHIYGVHKWIHWKPRADAVRYALDKLPRQQITRIVDFGCGLADLTEIATQFELPYWGIDSNNAMISYANQRFGSSSIKFSTGSCEILNEVAAGDVVILNGVVHHLDDDTLNLLLDHVRSASFLIILDHRGVRGMTSLNLVIPYLLQSFDCGNYVRPIDYFENISDYRLIEIQRFDIRVMKILMWPYFCGIYAPLK